MVDDYAVVPRIIRKLENISNGAKLCYVTLVDYAYNDVFAFPSQETLARELGRTVRMVRNYLQELREFGLIKVYTPPMVSGGRGNIDSSTNHYILMPLEDVANLRDRLTAKIPLDAQYVTQEEFNELIARNTAFFADGKIAARRDSYDASVKKVEEAQASGDFSKLSARDYCVAFAELYKITYGEGYAICWRTDSTAIKLVLLDRGIEGDGCLTVFKQFLKMYPTTFYSEKYKKPRISHLKVDWILSKVLTAVLDAERIEEESRAAEGVEVIDTWQL